MKKEEFDLLNEEEETGGLPDLEKYLEGRRRHLVNYSEGAKMYRIPYYSFVRLAREAEAHYCMRKTAIVDVDLIEKYLEEHPDVAERINTVREV
ncbi:MAG: hypothetical protein J5825_02030 [Lachnospiraceae bacterium]|nr:hypothetical protein [Lachnospiraceae bacterium]